MGKVLSLIPYCGGLDWTRARIPSSVSGWPVSAAAAFLFSFPIFLFLFILLSMVALQMKDAISYTLKRARFRRGLNLRPSFRTRVSRERVMAAEYQKLQLQPCSPAPCQGLKMRVSLKNGRLGAAGCWRPPAGSTPRFVGPDPMAYFVREGEENNKKRKRMLLCLSIEMHSKYTVFRILIHATDDSSCHPKLVHSPPEWRGDATYLLRRRNTTFVDKAGPTEPSICHVCMYIHVFVRRIEGVQQSTDIHTQYYVLSGVLRIVHLADVT